MGFHKREMVRELDPLNFFRGRLLKDGLCKDQQHGIRCWVSDRIGRIADEKVWRTFKVDQKKGREYIKQLML